MHYFAWSICFVKHLCIISFFLSKPKDRMKVYWCAWCIILGSINTLDWQLFGRSKIHWCICIICFVKHFCILSSLVCQMHDRSKIHWCTSFFCFVQNLCIIAPFVSKLHDRICNNNIFVRFVLIARLQYCYPSCVKTARMTENALVRLEHLFCKARM